MFPSAFPPEEFGESSQPTALPWDRIARADFQAAGTLNAVKSQLQKLHQARMDTSKAYKYLLEDISDFEQRLNNYHVSLNLIQLKKERETEEDRRLARTNVYRVAKKIPPITKDK